MIKKRARNNIYIYTRLEYCLQQKSVITKQLQKIFYNHNRREMEKIQNDLTTICTEKTIHMHDSRESIYK